MSAEPTHHAPEQHASFIKTPQQLVTLVVLAFVVPVVLIILLAKAVVSGRAPDPAVMAPEAIAQRIKPVADVAIAPSATPSAAAPAASAPPASARAAPAPAPAAAAPSPSPAPVAAAAQAAAAPAGKKVYEQACVACHGAGVAGAPKLGDKAAWAPRLKSGIDTLYASSLKGKGAMPPKGGQLSIADADIKAAVDYMLAAAK